jgi:LuxR family maltose regulon positive regulatory protein
MKQGSHGDYAQKILAAFGSHAAVPVADAGHIVEPFTNREEEILELLQQRLRDKEIADKLCISTETVKFHTRHIYQKLGVGSRREAVAKARSLGLLISR